MQADFLILLVSRTNTVIMDDSRCRWLQMALLYEQLCNAALSGHDAKALSQWAVRLRGVVTDVCALQAVGIYQQQLAITLIERLSSSSSY